MTDPNLEGWEDWKKSLVDALIKEATKAIEKAVLAERERCVRVIKSHGLKLVNTREDGDLLLALRKLLVKVIDEGPS